MLRLIRVGKIRYIVRVLLSNEWGIMMRDEIELVRREGHPNIGANVGAQGLRPHRPHLMSNAIYFLTQRNAEVYAEGAEGLSGGVVVGWGFSNGQDGIVKGGG
jgi:hypothetical protein